MAAESLGGVVFPSRYNRAAYAQLGREHLTANSQVRTGPYAPRPEFTTRSPLAAVRKQGEASTVLDPDAAEASHVSFVSRIDGLLDTRYHGKNALGMTSVLDWRLLPQGEEFLDVSLILTVSGHDGPELARQWAQTNVYAVRIAYEGFAGQHEEREMRVRSNGELSTVQDLSIPLEPGRWTIEAWPIGSAGVDGYSGKRRLFIDVPQNPHALRTAGTPRSRGAIQEWWA